MMHQDSLEPATIRLYSMVTVLLEYLDPLNYTCWFLHYILVTALPLAFIHQKTLRH